MSESTSRLPARPSLEQLHKQAKELLRQVRAGDSAVIHRFRSLSRSGEQFLLADAQFLIAREYGFENWSKLKQHVEGSWCRNPKQYEQLAKDLIDAYRGDPEALQHVNESFGNSFMRAGTPFTLDQLRAHIDERLRVVTGFTDRTGDITLADAQAFVARQYGLESWDKLLEKLAEVPAMAGVLAHESTPFYRIDWKENTIEPGPLVSDKDWDVVFAVMKDHRITGLMAGGRMTDAALARLSKLDHVTRLNFDGSLQITDAGLAYLAGLKGLQELDISGWRGRITDRGLEVLRHLPELRRFQLCWQQNVSDAGIANLAYCEHLESVNLLGSSTGDGSVAALTGKAKLRRFSTGRGVTDAGLELLYEFPLFKNWQGGDISYGLMRADAGPTHLLIDGPFTDEGLARLAGLNGLFGLTFFWHCPAFTSEGLAHMKDLANLGFLACQDQHCDDEAMRHIAAIPRLRMLMGQGAVATDAGFAALSRSQTLEYIWGRECANLTGRGFAALSAMPALRGIAVSCKNVDDSALSTLPRFPALRELMPMDVSDHGFRHVGQCEQLEGLWCMYCRDTGDVATGHIAGLSRLKTYYAGKTQITNRSLEILGEMDSIERLEFWQCAGITNEGVAHLASLPRLREISFAGSPGVTRAAAAFFGPDVSVTYSS